jgi:hypothetical protein
MPSHFGITLRLNALQPSRKSLIPFRCSNFRHSSPVL